MQTSIGSERKHTAVIVLAAGQGKRMGGSVQKQYLLLEGKPVLFYALQAFQQSERIDEIILAVGDEEQRRFCQKEVAEQYGFTKISHIVLGGRERYHSVHHALAAMEAGQDGYVFIHDSARPFVTEAMIERALEAAETYRACVVGMPVKDTIKLADENGFAQATPPRDRLWMIQTPQVFETGLIRSAYEELIRKEEELTGQGIRITDDAMVVETFTDVPVRLVPGSYENIKITTPEDLEIAQVFLKRDAFTEGKQEAEKTQKKVGKSC